MQVENRRTREGCSRATVSDILSPEGDLNMQKNAFYLSLDGIGLWAFQSPNPMPEPRTGRLAGRPISKWLDPLTQVSAAWLQLKGKKPWRKSIPGDPEIQQENRSLGSLASKALTALAGLCFPADRLSVSGVYVPETDRGTGVSGAGRIGRRRCLTAFAPT